MNGRVFPHGTSVPVADLREGARVPRGSNFFKFHAVFLGKFGKVVGASRGRGCHPHLKEMLDPKLGTAFHIFPL